MVICECACPCSVPVSGDIEPICALCRNGSHARPLSDFPDDDPEFD
jgi:hypothetical protein